jgi:hypothetical protein
MGILERFFLILKGAADGVADCSSVSWSYFNPACGTPALVVVVNTVINITFNAAEALFFLSFFKHSNNSFSFL